MWKKRGRKLNRDIIVAFTVCLLVFGASLGASELIDELVVERSFSQMADAVHQMSGDLASKIENERGQMRLVASMMSMHGHMSTSDWQEHMDTLPREGTITSYAVLLPDNTMIYEKGHELTLNGTFDFGYESRMASHMTDIITTLEGRYVAYVQPISQRGQVVGILYGFCELGEFASFFDNRLQDSKYQAYLIRRDSGNIIVDTWNNAPANLDDALMKERESINGRSFEEMKDDIRAGQIGYTVFRSKADGECYYSYYRPVGLENLVMQITVPESTVLVAALRIRHIIYWLGIIQLIVISIYLGFLFYEHYHERRGYQARMERSHFIYDIQQLLLGAHADPFSITAAMHLIADRIGARLVFFARLDEGKVRRIFCWPMQERVMLDNMDKRSHIAEAYKALCAGESVFIDDAMVERLKLEGRMGNLPGLDITNLFMVPITKKDAGLIGVLVAFNIREVHEGQNILESMAEPFMMAAQNIEAYDMIQRLGTVDQLTGLKNRNAYQQAMITYETSEKKICCIYVDANGLHDLNNTLGHAAGDKMLTTIANTLRENFGMQDVYRIGGDEFAVFCTDRTDPEIEERITRVKEKLEEKNYYVAAGWAFAEDDQFLQRAIDTAEKRMYLDKSRYYKTHGKDEKKRVANLELENIMAEKRDRDSFIRIIAANYLGVYAVNLGTDDTRLICRPNYFAEMLEATNYRFSKAIRRYMSAFVDKSSRDMFSMIFDYQMIAERIAKKVNIEFVYKRLDETMVRIRIYPAEDYSETNRNTLWIFEEVRI